MRWGGILVLLVSCKISAQPDVIKVEKEESSFKLFASLCNQIGTATATKDEVIKQGKLLVNDTIVISSYWFTCYSNGIQYQHQDLGQSFGSQTFWALNHLNPGGKAYFTEITGYSTLSYKEYVIFDLELIIKN